MEILYCADENQPATNSVLLPFTMGTQWVSTSLGKAKPVGHHIWLCPRMHKAVPGGNGGGGGDKTCPPKSMQPQGAAKGMLP